jgi:hypothetical protein
VDEQSTDVISGTLDMLIPKNAMTFGTLSWIQRVLRRQAVGGIIASGDG